MYEQSSKPDGFWGRGRKGSFGSSPSRVDLERGWIHRDVQVSVSVTENQCVPELPRTHLTRGRPGHHLGERRSSVSRNHLQELHREVCKFANVLKSLGLKKGDRATIYLPMIPELAIAMLACTRIGVVHSIVFAGFSPESLAGRILDCKGRVVITSDEGVRGGKPVPLKDNTTKRSKVPGRGNVMSSSTRAARPPSARAIWTGTS